MKLPLKQKIKFWLQTGLIHFFRSTILNFSSKTKNEKQRFSTLTFDKNASPLSLSEDSSITVILTAFQRIENIESQITAIRNQSIKPTEIWLWSNQSNEELSDVSSQVDRVIVNNSNFFSWGKFAIANLARTQYLAFFDDDIQPEPKWFDNCLKTINNGVDGIIGGSGVIINSTIIDKKQELIIGWNGYHNAAPVEVDFAKQALFFDKKHLQYIWREEPHAWYKSDDIHLSYMAKKYGDIKTYIAPHPKNVQSIWCCNAEFGKISTRSKLSDSFSDEIEGMIEQYINGGWKTVKHVPKTLTQQPITKHFNDELLLFTDKLNNHENFSIVRFGDGEMLIIKGEPIDLSKSTGGFKYTPNDTTDEKYRKILTQSLSFKSSNYFVGLPARCCVGDDYCDSLKELSNQSEKQLTWAAIFVNSNYPHFLNITVEAISKRKTNIICFNKARLENLPFQVTKDFRIGINAWVDDYEKTLADIDAYISLNNIENQVFIFCAGVLSNMLIYKLTEKHPNNTYLDVGSVFDLYLSLGKTRRYLRGNKKTLEHTCIW